ncbi:hypothetical protein OM428_06310 [Enterococcus gallinarum]|nr:hypothetical protein [Enterococcus gallinarum]
MDRKEKKEKKNLISKHLDTSNSRLKDEEVDFLHDFVINYDDEYKGKSKTKKVVMMDGVQTGNILVGKKKHLLLLKISGYVRNINIMMMMVKVEGILKKLKMPEVLLTGLKNKNKSVPKSGTLGISECVVRRLKALQHIYFLEVCIW